MTTMLFYENIEVLNRERHGGLHLGPAETGFSFAAGAHAVPAVADEFHQAAIDYPILFSGGEGDLAPMLLLGLEPGRNPLVDPDGQWQRGMYIPAFVRRYPFALARGADDDRGDLSVCIDAAWGGFDREGGRPLFDAEGNDSETLKTAIAFLRGYLAAAERTQAFVARLEALELLVRRDFGLTGPDGRRIAVRDFRAVDTAALDKLDEASTVELHRNGDLGLIHAHLSSLHRFRRMAHVPGALSTPPARVESEGGEEGAGPTAEGETAEPGHGPAVGPVAGGEIAGVRLQVLECLGRGMSNTDIARELAISESRVRRHVTGILATLGARNRKAAARTAMERGLIGAHDG